MSSLAGSFLVASPRLMSASFIQAVVLVMQHREEGAFGIIVNKLADEQGLSFPVYAGGPCPAKGLLILHGHPDWQAQPAKEAAPGIFIGDFSSLKRVSEAPAGSTLRCRALRGYASWAPGQLEAELAAGVWKVVPVNGEVLFDTPAEDLWERLALPRFPEPSIN